MSRHTRDRVSRPSETITFLATWEQVRTDPRLDRDARVVFALLELYAGKASVETTASRIAGQTGESAAVIRARLARHEGARNEC